VNKNEFYENFKVNVATSMEYSIIKANKSSFGVPWVGAGGCLLVWPLSKIGRIPTNPPLFTGHTAPITDFEFSPFDDNLVVTGSDDCHVKVWKVPESGLTENIATPNGELVGHQKRVNTVNFHPTASNVVVTCAGDQTAIIWDLNKCQLKQDLVGFSEYVQSVSFKGDGTLLVTTARDKIVRVFDPRAKKQAILTTNGHEGSKGSKAVWLGNKDRIFTVGVSKASERQFFLYDTRNITTPVYSVNIDAGAGFLLPFYDADTGIMFLGGKGDSSIKAYELIDDAPYAYPLSNYQATDPQVGLAMLPKSVCNIRNIEVARFLKLTKTQVQPIIFSVPRNKTEFFQDDIFVPTPDGNPAMTADEWFSGKNTAVNLLNLQPADMVALSQAPKEKRAKKKSQYFAAAQQQESYVASRDETVDALHSKVLAFKEGSGGALPQDKVQGVEAVEWDS